MSDVEVMVTLSWDEGRWAIERPKSTLTGYGRDDWRGHVAYEGRPTVVIDWSTMTAKDAAAEAIQGPMTKVGLEKDEGTGWLEFVTPATKAARVERLGGRVWWLTAQQARDLVCERCSVCRAPTFEWGGLRRHHGAKNVRLDNEEGVACPTTG